MGSLSEWALPESPDEAVKFMIHLLTVGSKPQYFQTRPLELYCTCSEERAKRALTLLTPRERNELSDKSGEENPSFEITCEYCGQSYRIGADAG